MNSLSFFRPEQGACTIPPAQAKGEGDRQVLRLEQVLAMLLGSQARNLEAQTGAPQSSLLVVLAVPPALEAQPGGAAAVHTAARIAGMENVRLVPTTTALAWHYSERHGKDIADADAPHTVLIVDVGHMAWYETHKKTQTHPHTPAHTHIHTHTHTHTHSSAVVARYTPREGANGGKEIELEILAQGGSFEVGGGVFDAALSQRMKEKLVKEHGADACRGAQFDFRLGKACEKLKKLLSTVDPAKLDLDSLIPDKDCRLTVTRKEWELLLEPSLARLKWLVTQVLAQSEVPPEGLEGVEVVGGGARVPAVGETILSCTAHDSLRHTLDSSAGARSYALI